jgi:hypothetical protein
MPVIGAMPRYGPNQKPREIPKTSEPMLKKVEASVGTAKRPQAFRIPMACAASATTSRNGNMMRVSAMARENLPGSAVAQPGASSPTSAGLNTAPKMHTRPTIRITAVAARLESSAASFFPLVERYSVKVGTKAEDRAPSAKRSRVRFGMRKPRENAS